MADDVNLEEFVMTKDEFSGADIKAICTEAGLLALRERRMKVRLSSFVLCSSWMEANWPAEMNKSCFWSKDLVSCNELLLFWMVILQVTQVDFKKAKEKVMYKKKEGVPEGLYM